MRETSIETDIERAKERGCSDTFSNLSDEELTSRLRSGAADIAAAQARWLELLHEIVVRGIPGEWGFPSPASWLSWAVGMSVTTARDHVRVALRLPRFPRTAELFARGELSFSKVRAITRADRPELESSLITFAGCASAAQLDRIVRHTRQLAHIYDSSIPSPATMWELADVAVRHPEEGMIDLRFRMPEEDAYRALAVLHRRAEALRSEALAAQPSDDEPVPTAPTDASAEAPTSPEQVVEPILPGAAYTILAFMDACETLAAKGPTDTSGRDRHTLVLHADADDLVEPTDDQPLRVAVRVGESGRRAAMDPRVLRRLACEARYAVVGHGEQPGVSGTTSAVPARLRRVLEARDEHCRFTGCGATRHVEAHHIVHRADGGPTELANLVLLCRFHHQFVHRKGWQILHDGKGHFRFEPPGEFRLPAPTLPGASAEAPLPPANSDPARLELEGYDHYAGLSDAVGVLLDAIERAAPPPASEILAAS